MATLDRLVPPPTLMPLASTWSPRRAIAAALTLAAAIAVLQVFQSSGFANTGQTLQDLEVERSTTVARIHTLEAELAALSSLDRTERAARERLGMVPPARTAYIAVAVPGPTGPLLPGPQVGSPSSAQTRSSASPWWKHLLNATPLF